MRKLLILLLPALACCAGCSTSRHATKDQPVAISALHFLSEFDLPHNLQFKGTTVGGLSGIDYDVKRQCYYLICDDRSAINPARFYTVRIAITGNRIDSVGMADVHFLTDSMQQLFPDHRKDPRHSPDPEALRYNPLTEELVWTSEGERIVGPQDTILEDPAITRAGMDGHFKSTYPIPGILAMKASEAGPRRNGVLEGLSFTPGFRSMLVSVEEPLYEDGPRADTFPNEPWIRLLRYDLQNGLPVAQYAYELDPVAHPAKPADAFKVNGVADILCLGDQRILTLERSFSTGTAPCTIKIFSVDLSKASDISGNPGLLHDKQFVPAKKELLLNMDDLGRYIDNVEGMCFGPVLANGHRSMIFVSDNNFSAAEKTQFFLFEVIP